MLAGCCIVFTIILAFSDVWLGGGRTSIAISSIGGTGASLAVPSLLLENPNNNKQHTHTQTHRRGKWNRAEDKDYLISQFANRSCWLESKLRTHEHTLTQSSSYVLDRVFTVGYVCHATRIRFFIWIIVAAGHQARTPTRHDWKTQERK